MYKKRVREDEEMVQKASRGISLKNKWSKTKWLVSDNTLRYFVPETKQFTKSSLADMTSRYKVVYFKPAGGTGGNGIARIVKTPEDTFQYKMNKTTGRASSVETLYYKLKHLAKGRDYLLQKGIELQTLKGKPFDIRSMVQKTAGGKWVHTVIFVKIGRKNKVVTNYHQGGKLALVEPTLRGAGYTDTQIEGYLRELKELSLQTARCFDQHNPRFKELGLDVALDSNGRLWILEVNTRPNFYALKLLPDPDIYRTVIKHGKAYGRTR